ncbi:hypothetical protein B0T25DRAFT_451070 [Lasiosphaeria hispida]|uniref:RING-type domain-containing protein n=1 Tax=Lasiosphaeria hispida TaxID=260671 RepID=A0AAJ0HM82_9PEZI|nr:hypothetical protein B0T25DRAFT_451070 [Lasiosphaeria hispida]
MESSSKPAVNLETELTCSICTELLYQPLTLLDCLHTFCGACLKEWFSWQAARAEAAPVPPAPDAAVFTCPACRDRVRDTKHDARVTTLLDMFLALNPDRAKPAAERDEMDAKYRKGEKVLPKLSFADRSEEQKRLDGEERRLIEAVQRVSLRDAREASREGAAPRPPRPQARERESSRRRAQSATLHAEAAADDGRRRRSESRQRRTAASTAPSQTAVQTAVAAEAVRTRHIEHQSSLRSLIGTVGTDSRDVEREIEEFARQIQEEGLLNGLDLDNIDLNNNDELSKRITEAYRRRYRERARQDGGRRSNASSHSYRSDLSAAATRPRSRTGDSSRPTSRQTTNSRPASANNSDGEQRGRYPPSSSTHLEVQESGRRRRTRSSSRSATAPVAPTQELRIGVGARSQTDLAIRPDQAIRPVIADARSTSSPTTVTSVRDLPDSRGHMFGARTAGGLGIQGLTEPVSDSRSSSRKRPVKPAELVIADAKPTAAATSGPLGTGLSSPPLSSPRRALLPRYKEPFIVCKGCGKEHIEYELHYNCSICHNGEWNICLDCWRRRKGCLHWFGFGHAAWDKWDKVRAADKEEETPPPHMLTANRYLPPKATPGGAEGRRTLTTENPLDRLQSGTFCMRCTAWTNDCYWRCDMCNEGEWGFCNDCVDQGHSCTHPLLPLAYQQPPSSSSQPTTPTHSPPASPSSRSRSASASASASASPSRPPTATLISGPTAVAIGNFRLLTFAPPCDACHRPIPPAESRMHCYACPSEAAEAEPRSGGYNVCYACYQGWTTSGKGPARKLAPENGAAGWRRCLRGHRMVVVAFAADERGVERRAVLQDVVGGRRLGVEGYECGKVELWYWTEGKGRVERLVSLDVRAAAVEVEVDAQQGRWAKTFPPDGGTAPPAAAGWGWYPAEGVQDELMFPKGAEVLEAEDVNGEWFHGFYMGVGGLFPAPYVRVGRRDGS